MNENVADRPLPDVRNVPLMTLVHEGIALDRPRAGTRRPRAGRGGVFLSRNSGSS
jgi:hypothetical protein